MFEDLKGKVAIVTGARRGIGRAHCLILAKHGVKVVVSDVSQEDCEKVVQKIRRQGRTAMTVKCDVSKKEEVERLIQNTIKEFGKVDILVNNAGIVQFQPFLELSEQDWDKTLNVNLKGYFLCAQTAAREMAKQKKGVIVNIASVAMGQIGCGFAGIVHYCASKGGIVAMAEAMALELAPLGIRVNTVSPGAIDTPMMESTKQNPQALEGILGRIPLQKVGKPEDVSNLVLFLCSDASSYMTGSTVVIDGGWLAG